jgi:hypothetical protein
MGGAYQVRTLIEVGALGLLIVAAVALTVAGMLLRPESRRRFVLWCTAFYVTGWMAFVFYNAVVLTRYFVKIIR